MQLESRSGVENVEKIAAVDGVDVLFIGECNPALNPPPLNSLSLSLCLLV